MNEPLQNLIEALREELKQYGEMLALLDHQQELVMQRRRDELLPSVAAINTQAEAIQAARQEREQRHRRLGELLELGEGASFAELRKHLPPEYRPLVDALVQENKELLGRVQKRARQNHLLLSRVVELMQRMICTIHHAGGAPTYTGGGEVLTPGLQTQIYDAIG